MLDADPPSKRNVTVSVGSIVSSGAIPVEQTTDGEAAVRVDIHVIGSRDCHAARVERRHLLRAERLEVDRVGIRVAGESCEHRGGEDGSGEDSEFEHSIIIGELHPGCKIARLHAALDRHSNSMSRFGEYELNAAPAAGCARRWTGGSSSSMRSGLVFIGACFRIAKADSRGLNRRRGGRRLRGSGR